MQAHIERPVSVTYNANFGRTVEEVAHAFPAIIPPLSDDFRQIEELRQLEPDWDSYGATMISPDAAQEAKTLVSYVAWSAGKRGYETHPYYIGPIPTGGVQLEWRHDEREIRVEVRPDATLKAMFVRWAGDRRTREYRDNISIYEIVPMIVGFVATA